jgi:hypothetical protein
LMHCSSFRSILTLNPTLSSWKILVFMFLPVASETSQDSAFVSNKYSCLMCLCYISAVRVVALNHTIFNLNLFTICSHLFMIIMFLCHAVLSYYSLSLHLCLCLISFLY